MKKFLNLDKDFSPIEGYEITHDTFQFSGGEWHIKIDMGSLSYNREVTITQRIHNGDDIMKVLIAKEALERIGYREFNLIIPYLPYARQDKICAKGESLSIKVFANLINSMKFNQVTILDPHSTVSEALIDNCNSISSLLYIAKIIILLKAEKNIPMLISPDNGAYKKVFDIARAISSSSDIVKCDKVREPDTGTILKTEVYCDDLEGRDCLLIDDICDGGRTFIEIAKILKTRNPGRIHLFVTHGIFSKGFDELNKYFDNIFTTNSFKGNRDSKTIELKIEL